MARKDFDEYYNSVCKQFFQLNEVFDEFAKEVAEGMVEPERKIELEKTIEPIKASYQTLSYIKYLLDKPTRKNKHEKYNNMSKKILSQSKGKHMDEVLKTNSDILDKLSN